MFKTIALIRSFKIIALRPFKIIALTRSFKIITLIMFKTAALTRWFKNKILLVTIMYQYLCKNTSIITECWYKIQSYTNVITCQNELKPLQDMLLCQIKYACILYKIENSQLCTGLTLNKRHSTFHNRFSVLISLNNTSLIENYIKDSN